MKSNSFVFVLFTSRLALVQCLGGWGGAGGWGAAPDCATSCFTSLFPSPTSKWSQICATPTALPSCISSACSASTSVFASATSVQSSLCSVYSSCLATTSACGGWGPFGFGGDQGWGQSGASGIYTFTGTDGRTSGFTTRTMTATITVPASDSTPGLSSTSTFTSTQTATIVAAAVTTGSSTSASETQGAANSGREANQFVALVVAAVGAIIAL